MTNNQYITLLEELKDEVHDLYQKFDEVGITMILVEKGNTPSAVFDNLRKAIEKQIEEAKKVKKTDQFLFDHACPKCNSRYFYHEDIDYSGDEEVHIYRCGECHEKTWTDCDGRILNINVGGEK